VETLLERFPDGAPDKTIAQALMISIEDVESLYNGIVAKLRAQLDPSL
jgi:DNA-binding CsgD family transcriptional regulator